MGVGTDFKARRRRFSGQVSRIRNTISCVAPQNEIFPWKPAKSIENFYKETVTVLKHIGIIASRRMREDA
jgi:hypothetical protein